MEEEKSDYNFLRPQNEDRHDASFDVLSERVDEVLVQWISAWGNVSFCVDIHWWGGRCDEYGLGNFVLLKLFARADDNDANADEDGDVVLTCYDEAFCDLARRLKEIKGAGVEVFTDYWDYENDKDETDRIAVYECEDEGGD